MRVDLCHLRFETDCFVSNLARSPAPPAYKSASYIVCPIAVGFRLHVVSAARVIASPLQAVLEETDIRAFESLWPVFMPFLATPVADKGEGICSAGGIGDSHNFIAGDAAQSVRGRGAADIGNAPSDTLANNAGNDELLPAPALFSLLSETVTLDIALEALRMEIVDDTIASDNGSDDIEPSTEGAGHNCGDEHAEPRSSNFARGTEESFETDEPVKPMARRSAEYVDGKQREGVPQRDWTRRRRRGLRRKDTLRAVAEIKDIQVSCKAAIGVGGSAEANREHHTIIKVSMYA